MGNDRTRPRPVDTRTWPPPRAAEPVAQVADPAVRALFLARRRALLQEVREIERRCGLNPDDPDDAAA